MLYLGFKEEIKAASRSNACFSVKPDSNNIGPILVGISVVLLSLHLCPPRMGLFSFILPA